MRDLHYLRCWLNFNLVYMTLLCWRSTCSSVICAVFITSGHGPTSNVSVHFTGLAFGLSARISKTNAARNNECVIFTLVSTPPFTANLTHKSVCITIFNFQASKSHYSAAKGRAHQAPQPSISLTRSFQFAVALCKYAVLLPSK